MNKSSRSTSARATKASSGNSSSKRAVRRQGRVPAQLKDTGHHNASQRVKRVTIADSREHPRFSSYHPMLPKRYVPPWQLDMVNRKLIIQNCQMAGNPSWRGHVSYYLQGRERVSATSYRQTYRNVLSYSRQLRPIHSHLSRYNSGLMHIGTCTK